MIMSCVEPISRELKDGVGFIRDELCSWAFISRRVSPFYHLIFFPSFCSIAELLRSFILSSHINGIVPSVVKGDI